MKYSRRAITANPNNHMDNQKTNNQCTDNQDNNVFTFTCAIKIQMSKYYSSSAYISAALALMAATETQIK
jgi:hypothetical protein